MSPAMVGIAIAVFVALAYLSLSWFAYALLGLALGWGGRYVIHRLRTSKGFRIATAAILSGAILTAFLFFSSIFRMERLLSPPAPPPIVTVAYSALIAYVDAVDGWSMREEILVKAGDDARVVTDVETHGWRHEGTIESKQRFVRSRNIPAVLRWQARTTNTIALELPRYVYPDTTSTVTISAPKYFIGTTFPPPSARADVLEGGQESLIVPIRVLTLELEPRVRIELLSPLLRWRFGPDIARFSLWDGAKWFFLVICFVFSEQIKKHLITPTVRPLFAWIRFRRPAPGDAGQSRGDKQITKDGP